MTYIEKIPKPLLSDIVNGRCFPIIGAGFSKNATVPEGQSIPLWEELGRILAQDIALRTYTTAIDAVSGFEHKCGRTKLIETLKDLLLVNSSQPSALHVAFCRIPFSMVCTTNIDCLLEKGYDAAKRKYHVNINEKDLPVGAPEGATILLKLHGDLNQPDSLILTEDDYDDFTTRKPLIVTTLTNQLVQYTPLLIGYSARDDDFRQVWRLVRRHLENLAKKAYAITVGASEDDVNRLKRRNIQVINLDHDLKSYSKALEQLLIELEPLVQKTKERRLSYDAVSLFSKEKELRFEFEQHFNPLMFKIAIEAEFEDSESSLEYSYFFDDKVEQSKKNALEKFEKEMHSMPLDWEGQHVTAKKLKITRYSRIYRDKPEELRIKPDVFKVIITSKIGSETNYFRFTIADFGEDVDETEKELLDRIKKDTSRLKSIPSEILERHVYIGEYVKDKLWEEDVEEKILLLSEENMPKEEQKEKIKSYFSKKFDFEIEYFLSLDEICSTSKYFENLELIKNRICDIFGRDPRSFSEHMTQDSFREFAAWADDYRFKRNKW